MDNGARGSGALACNQCIRRQMKTPQRGRGAGVLMKALEIKLHGIYA